MQYRGKPKQRSYKWIYLIIILVFFGWLIFDQPPQTKQSETQEIIIKLPNQP